MVTLPDGDGGGYGDECLAICPDLSGAGLAETVVGNWSASDQAHCLDGDTGTLNGGD